MLRRERRNIGKAVLVLERELDAWWAESEMHRMQAKLLPAMGDHTAAEDGYQQALAVARRQSAKFCP
jgi:hypothetical protein